jgi:hypothetical protein
MKISAVGLLLLAANLACSSENCADTGCVSRLEVSATFMADGEWSVSFGSYGACNVTVVSSRVTSTICSGSAAFSGSADGDLFLIDALPQRLSVTYAGVEEGFATVTPSYEDLRPFCSPGCLVGEAQIIIGS